MVELNVFLNFRFWQWNISYLNQTAGRIDASPEWASSGWKLIIGPINVSQCFSKAACSLQPECGSEDSA